MKKTLYNQFCAGETKDEVEASMKGIKQFGFNGTILTSAQEAVYDHQASTVTSPNTEGEKNGGLCRDIRHWRDGTLRTVSMLGEGDQLAVKLTGAGATVTKSLEAGELPPQQMLDALDQICLEAQTRKACVVVDAESQRYQPGIHQLGLYLTEKYNADGQCLIYNTYQAYLKSAPDTLSRDLAIAGEKKLTLGIKLVRGAYLSTDPRHLIHDTKQDTDNAYNHIAHGLLKQELYRFGRHGDLPFPAASVILAGHNRASILSAYELYKERAKHGLPTTQVGFAQLQGMSDEIGLLLVQLNGNEARGPKIYKCSTWGSLEDCLGYLFRRATENREAASRTVEGLIALRAELKRRVLSNLLFWRQSQQEK